ncbi:MAG: hypothetical protein AAB478_00550 [Patescibacteria group bacterium]
MSNHKKLLYIIISTIIIVLYVVLSIVLFISNQRTVPKQITTIFTTPTPIIERRPSLSRVPLLKKIETQASQAKPLTASESAIRNTLINKADKFGYVYSEKDFSIVYINDYDAFQIRLNSVDLTTAKQHALSWLGTQGFSHNGICKLPVFFYAKTQTGIAISLDPSYCQ